MALESEEDKCMYAFGAALATQTDQFKKVRRKRSVTGGVDSPALCGMRAAAVVWRAARRS